MEANPAPGPYTARVPRANGARLGRTVAAWALAVLAGAAPAVALAQDEPGECLDPPRAPIEVTPASGSGGVTLDAPVLVRYADGYFGPDGPGGRPASLLRVWRCEGGCGSVCSREEGLPVPGTVQRLGDTLAFLPEDALDPSSAYVGRAEGVDGSLDFAFCTSSRLDSGPPSFGDIDEASSAVVGATCDLPDGGFRIGVFFEPASDDGPPGSIEYRLYQTRGEEISAPVLVDRVRNFATDVITMSFLLPQDHAATPICVQVVAVDGVGNVTQGSAERCLDPVTRVAFEGLCSVSTPGAATSPPWPLALALLVLAWRRARARDTRSKRLSRT